MSIEEILVIIFMTVCTVTDIRKKEIPLIWLLLFSIVAIVFGVIHVGANGMYFIYSLIPGAFLLMLSLCTRESIGYGDGWVVLILGALAGLEKCLFILVTGFLLSAVGALILLICRKANGKSRLPFLPFLFIGLGVSAIV